MPLPIRGLTSCMRERLAAIGGILPLRSGRALEAAVPTLASLRDVSLHQSFASQKFVRYFFQVTTLTVESIVQPLHLLIGNFAG